MAFHIVIIDDDLALQEFYRLFLEGEGYKVTILSPFTFSLDAIAVLQPDLIILDILLAGKQSGWSILQVVTDTPQTMTFPVLLVTALTMAAFEAEWKTFIQERNIPLILKPFDVDMLLTAISLFLPAPSPSLADSSYNEPIN